MVNNDLIEMLISVGRELEAENSNAVSPAVPAKIRVVVEGTARPVHPTVQDNLYRIAREAMSNALSHAQAGLIEVEIRYGRRMLRLRIRDDGRGMDPGLVLEGGRAGHWGLPGMRERTRSIGGHFELWSEIRQGTEIEVTIPGVIAYRPPGDTSARLLVGKGDV
jgi:signal transduction histidine kinase